MISAVSRPPRRKDSPRTQRPATQAARPTVVPWHSREGVYYVAVRELNDETRAEIRKAQCQATWLAIHDALRDQHRRGRTQAIRDAAALGCLDDVGVMGLHRYSGGLTPKTIRRHLECLERIGLIKVCRPPVSSYTITTCADGRRRLHKAKGQGREKALRIVVTVDAERHCRPNKKTAGHALRKSSICRPDAERSYGEPVPTPAPVLMGSQCPPTKEILSKEKATTSETDGVGSAAAAGEAPGLPAGEAGGLPAATQEGGTQEGGDTEFMPTLPPPRQRQARQAPPRRDHRPDRQADAERPSAEDMAAKWRREAAESARKAQEYLAARKAARSDVDASTTPRPASTPPTSARAADAAKGAFRDEWRNERGLPASPTPTPPADADAAMLDEIIRRRRTGMGAVPIPA